jgi:hypothetical protein
MSEAVDIVVKGQKELEASFMELRKETLTEMRPALLALAEPVRSDAQTLAGTQITNIGMRWSRMRIGATVSGVYVAPTSRRRGGSPRRNLAGLLMDDAMQPALDRNQAEIVSKLDEVVNAWSAKAGLL